MDRFLQKICTHSLLIECQIIHQGKYQDTLSDPDDMHRAQIHRFLNTTTEVIRYNSFCPVTIKPVVLGNF